MECSQHERGSSQLPGIRQGEGGCGAAPLPSRSRIGCIPSHCHLPNNLSIFSSHCFFLTPDMPFQRARAHWPFSSFSHPTTHPHTHTHTDILPWERDWMGTLAPAKRLSQTINMLYSETKQNCRGYEGNAPLPTIVWCYHAESLCQPSGDPDGDTPQQTKAFQHGSVPLDFAFPSCALC